MSAINRIQVSGFKSIRYADVKLKKINILIGANGAGKSNFISVFEMLNQMIEKNLQTFIGKSGFADALLHFGKKTTTTLNIRLYFGRNDYEAIFTPAQADTLIFQSENCYFYGNYKPTPIEESFGSGHKETNLYTKYDKNKFNVPYYVVQSLQNWKVYHFHDTSTTAKVKQSGEVSDNEFFRPDASNLAAFLYYLQQRKTNSYEKIVKTIQMVAPFFEDFNLRPSPLNPEKIQLEWHTKGTDAYFNASALSDGTLRFICLTTLLLQPGLPSTILIDEPELGLHPYAISLLASMIKSASTKTQLIISTQSSTLINHFEPEDIIVVDREENQSVFKRLDTTSLANWLTEYNLGELWEKNVIGGRPE